jgi:NAD(P)-dependent dehydrogenase (short-subunit alcohol dehydrogenase family)
MELAGKTVLVTGAARRVGSEIALTLARRGANVAVHYRSSAPSARDMVRQITALGVGSVAVRAELTKAREVSKMVARVVDHFGQIDVLVNNAAVFPKTPFEKIREFDWDFSIDTNLKGPFLCAHEVGKHFLSRAKAGSNGLVGKIINIADWAGFRPYRDYLPYCVSKAGVIALTKALALELAPHATVNAIAPGPILLPENFEVSEKKEVLTRTPLRRVGSPQDIAKTIEFLVEGSDFITGAIVPVDGGRLIA